VLARAVRDGLVEAPACGTPVIAVPEGAAVEIVINGDNGMLVAGEAEMVRPVKTLGVIDPLGGRVSVAERYDAAVCASGYERVYRRAVAQPVSAEEPLHITMVASRIAVGLGVRGDEHPCRPGEQGPGCLQAGEAPTDLRPRPGASSRQRRSQTPGAGRAQNAPAHQPLQASNDQPKGGQ